MRNGFTKALAAVAMAWLGSQAFASAPVVRDLPDAVVANDTPPAVTGANPFIFPDFIDLASPAVVSDDGPVTSLTWSYDGTGRYTFNGAQPLNIGTESPVTPPAPKVINSSANITATGEVNPDANAFTPTIRDTTLTPFSGTAQDPAGTQGIINSEVVTLFASDGTTIGQNDLIVYTDDGGVDDLSALPPAPAINVYSADFTTGTNGWFQGTNLAVGGTVTFSQTGGLCVSVSAAGVNIGEWVSPYPVIDLVDNAVYRIRLQMTTSQTTAGSVPLWDVQIQNLSLTPVADNTTQAFIGDYFFLDNTGSANAIKGPVTGLNQFDVWYTPAQFRTAQWRNTTTGAFAPANSAAVDARLAWRILDADNNAYGAGTDSGQICVTNVTVDRFDYANVIEGATVYTLNPITSGVNGVTAADVIGTGAGAGSVRDFSTSPLTITPLDPAGWITELTLITPGDTNNPTVGSGGYGDGSLIVDNFPIPWDANTLYMYTVEASAPNATGESDPADAIRLAFDTATTELLGDSYVTRSPGLAGTPGMPKQGTPQPYTMFWWSHNSSLSTFPNAARMRWKLDVLNTVNFDSGPNAGGVRFQNISVKKVTFPSM